MLSLTVIRYFVDPFIERRIKFRHNMLFPLLTDESQKDFRLVDRVLRHIVSVWKKKNISKKEAYNRSISKRKYVTKFEEADKEGDCRRLVRRLLEYSLRIRVLPVLVIAFDRVIEVKTAKC